MPLVQVPAALQVWGILPLHCLVFGVHMPAHMPRLQTFGQTPPLFVHLPSASHSWGWFPLHCKAAGVHVPVQALFLQT